MEGKLITAIATKGKKCNTSLHLNTKLSLATPLTKRKSNGVFRKRNETMNI
jgi:hypothetical protein